MGLSEEWLRENYWDAERILASPPGGRGKVAAGTPGKWEIVIDGWMPATKNLKSGHWTRWYNARKKDNEVVANHLLGVVPPAWCKRRVELVVVKRDARHLPDPQNLEESLYDALVHCKALVDDKGRWLERVPTGDIVVDRSLSVPVRSTIRIEDVIPGDGVSIADYLREG